MRSGRRYMLDITFYATTGEDTGGRNRRRLLLFPKTMATLKIWKDTGRLIQIERPADLVARFNRFVALADRKEANLGECKLAEYMGTTSSLIGRQK
jgi:hypothetical protein